MKIETYEYETVQKKATKDIKAFTSVPGWVANGSCEICKFSIEHIGSCIAYKVEKRTMFAHDHCFDRNVIIENEKGTTGEGKNG